MSTTTAIESKAPAAAQATMDALRRVLSDTYLLLVKTHGYHWNVEGDHFFALHTAFEAQYNDLFKAVDDIAERIRALGGKAPASLAEFSVSSSIKDGKAETEANEMVAALVNDHHKLSELCLKGIKDAENNGDAVTADMLTARATVHDKTAWMMRSYLK